MHLSRLFFRICLTALALLPMLFSACNVPEAQPTATATEEVTATPILPTATATPFPTATATAVPEYLNMSPSDLDGTTLTLRCSLDGKVREKLEELTALYNEENSDGITVQLEISSATDAFLTDAAAAQSGLLIARSDLLRNLQSNGLGLMDLSDFMNAPELALEGDDPSPIMPVMLAQEWRGETLYALPLWADPAFLFYNKTWALWLGYEKSPEDLVAFAEQACAAGKANYADKDDAKHGTGGWIVSSDTEDVLSWMLAFAQGGQTMQDLMQDPDGSVFTDMASWLRNLYDNGCIWNSRVREPYDYFANRYALFYSGTYSDAERQINAFSQSESYSFDNWDLIVYPGRSSGKSEPHIYGDTISAAIVRGDAAEMRAAWQFIRWLYQGTHAAELALAANSWPVQDTDEVTRLYRNSGEDKLYQTLSYRQYLVPNNADGSWLTDQLILADGFAYIFNPSASQEDIPAIWEQIGIAIAEISTVTSGSGASAPETSVETGENHENEP